MAVSESDPRRNLVDNPDEAGDKYVAQVRRETRRSRGIVKAEAEKVVQRHTKAAVQQERAALPKADKPGELHFDLADLFLSQPWVHTYRGDTKPLATVKVGMSKALVATILRDKIKAEARFEGRDEQRVKEVVEYAMKHFFARVPNDQRTARLVNQFVGDDWWDTLIDESIDHWTTLRVPEEAYERGRTAAEGFYGTWPKKETTLRGKTPQEAAQRFQQIYEQHLAAQPNYDENEELQ